MPGIPTLRPYQQAPARAILDSVRRRRGLTFTVEMSRQSGKNELSAQLETAILTLAAADPNAWPAGPVTIVKAAPTFSPQAQISIRRLTATLRTARLPLRTEAGHIIHVGPATAAFLSAEPSAKVVGHTANPLLEIDEAQDIDPDKFDRDFRPMAAAFNATTVLYGTAWSDISLLHRERQRALRLERSDHIQRAFIVPWPIPAATLPAYDTYVRAERDRLGPTHPLFTTQYDLEPLPGHGRLFSPTLIAQLHGDFARRPSPPVGATIAAGLDIAGASDRPAAHDRTVLTIAAVTAATSADPLPANHIAVLHHVSWQGTPHDTLLPQLIDLITKVWKPAALTVDATGLGETTARILAARARRTVVTPLKFTQQSKSLLGYALIAATATGRLKVYHDPDDPDANTFWSEVALARADYTPNQTMTFYVDPADGHDDYVTSLALLTHAADLATPRVARGHRTCP